MDQHSDEESAPSVAYDAFLRAGRFRLQVCDDCGQQIYFARTICNHCGSGRLTWTDASGAGTVYSSTTIRRKADRGGDYNLAIVELAEGARMMSRVEGIPASDVHIGMRVEASIVAENDKPLVIFLPAKGEKK